LSFIVALVWGFTFHCLAEVIAFLVVFIPLRMHTGGYHASTYFRCLLAFILMLAILKLFIEWVSTPMIAPITVLVSLITLLSVFLFAPIQHPNAPIRGSDRSRFKRIARLICLFDIVIVSVFINTPLLKAPNTSIITAINCGLFFASVLIIIGQLTHAGKEVNAK
jgi:accessory gene regulator B